MGARDICANARGNHITTAEFENLSLLRTAIAETHDKKFIVGLPAHVAAADRLTRLDLSAQGIDIAVHSPPP